MIVADASLLANLIIPELDQTLAEAVYRFDPQWRAPGLWQYELRNVLLKYVKTRGMTETLAVAFMDRAFSAIQGAELQAPSLAVISTGASLRISSYDAEYVALARELGVPLVTFDKKLAKAASGIAFLPADFVARES